MNLLLRWLIIAAALYVAAWIVPGITLGEGVAPVLVAALVIGLINALVKPVLVILTFPITVLTLGLFYLVLNGALFYLAAVVTPGLDLTGFGAAFLGALVMSLTGMALHALIPAR